MSHQTARPPLRVLAALLLGACAACDSSTDPADLEIVEHRVRPSEANAAVTSFDDEHHVWFPGSRAGGAAQLMILLPGSNGRPAHATMVGRTAAEQGYHVIGLMYPDDRVVVQECAADPSPDCSGLMREEIVRGADLSPHVDVDLPNSIDGRLLDLLRYLSSRFPSEGWERFIDGDELRWSAIAVAGLSQGGGHAAYIARLRAVPRVVMFGAPVDGLVGAVAEWVSPGATPASRYYGFVHQRDPFTNVVSSWRALGLGAFGEVVVVESAAPPYGGSHMLTTDVLPAVGGYANAHASVFADVVTPRGGDGTPVFLEAWRYLFGVP